MQDVYERPFQVVISSKEAFPNANEQPVKVGGHTNGCRIGLDAGGFDRKVSAVIDGETVYFEEIVWHPKTSADLRYQYDGIVAAFMRWSKPAFSSRSSTKSTSGCTKRTLLHGSAASFATGLPSVQSEAIKDFFHDAPIKRRL